jgi:hypothetical protein
MMRKTILALVASAAIVVTALPATEASAHWGWHRGWHHYGWHRHYGWYRWHRHWC